MNVHQPEGDIDLDAVPEPVPYGRTSRFFPASDLEGKPVPPRPWLVRDLVPGRTVTLLGGDGGTGKSLLALQLAVAVATGRTWLGRTVSEGGALFMSAEDDTDELHRRLQDIARHCGTTLAEMHRLELRSLAGEDALLACMNRTGGALAESSLYHELEATLAANPPALLVLDTLADLFPGNENDRAHARQFIGLLRRLAMRHDCAILLLAHPSLSGISSGAGTSGSTGWNNSVRSRLYLQRITNKGYEANPDARILENMKSNHGRTGGTIGMTWQDGVFVADPQETGLDRAAGNAKAERVFLKLLRQYASEGRYVSSSGPTSAPRAFSEHPGAEGCTKIALKRAMDSLFQKGRIRMEQHGSGAKARRHIAEVQPVE